MTKTAVKAANIIRKDAFLQQKELRVKMSDALAAVAKKADPRLLFEAWAAAEQDRRAFLSWLGEQRKGMKDMRVIRVAEYILRNTGVLGGMNAYMDKLSRAMVAAAETAGVVKESRAIARTLAQGIKKAMR